MGLKTVLVTLVFCAIVEIESDTSGTSCESCRRQVYIRIKRAKYYSNPPQKFYRRPPITHPVRGPFSYTPPPGYMTDDEEPTYPRTKVSRRPTNEGLADEDITNMLKYLSKKDLDKIVEFAGERYPDKYREERRPHELESEKFSSAGPYGGEDDDRSYGLEKPKIIYASQPDAFLPNQEFSLDTNHDINYIKDATQPKIVYVNPSQGFNTDNNPNINYLNDATQPKVIYVNPPQNSNPINSDEQPKVPNSNQIEYMNSNNGFGPPNANMNQMNQPKIIYVNTGQTSNYVQNPNYNPNELLSNTNNNPTRTTQYYNYNNAYSNGQSNNMYSYPTEPSRYPIDNYRGQSNAKETPLYTYDNSYSNTPLETQETKDSYQVSFVNAHVQDVKEVTENLEDVLPKPANLREDDIDVSFTNNVPKVAKAETSSYELKNFGDLPLMNFYNSKLHTVDSYNVPHYTVTSPAGYQKPPASSSTLLKPSKSSQSIKTPPLEVAPPGYDGKDQSDAHLKAIRIWTHHSKGKAYTLHDDGTLSVERPIKPKYGR